MSSTPEKIERKLFVGRGRDHNNLQLRSLAQQFRYRFHRIGSQRRLENQNVGGEFRQCGLRLGQRFSLSHNPDIVFESEYLAQAGAKNHLCVGKDNPDQRTRAVLRLNSVIFAEVDRAGHYFLCAYARSKRYSSITQPTPLRPLSSKLRTTRPWQSICTSHCAPTTSPGSRMMKSTIEPTGTSRSIANRTPFAEIFWVSARQSPLCDFNSTGRWSGKRGALCISAYCLIAICRCDSEANCCSDASLCTVSDEPSFRSA